MLEKSSFGGDLMFRDGTCLEERGGRDGKSWEDTGLDRVGTGAKKRRNNYVEVVRQTTMLSSVEYNF